MLKRTHEFRTERFSPSKEERDHTKQMGDYGGNCGDVNMKGTNECCAADTNDKNDGSQN